MVVHYLANIVTSISTSTYHYRLPWRLQLKFHSPWHLWQWELTAGWQDGVGELTAGCTGSGSSRLADITSLDSWRLADSTSLDSWRLADSTSLDSWRLELTAGRQHESDIWRLADSMSLDSWRLELTAWCTGLGSSQLATDLIGQNKFLPWRQLGCSVTRPFSTKCVACKTIPYVGIPSDILMEKLWHPNLSRLVVIMA